MPAAESRPQPILAAMIRVVGTEGYKAASVAGVIEAAGTSRATFYRHFEDKHDCFLAAYEMLVEQIIAKVLAGCDGSRPWLARVTGGLATMVDLFAADPALARTAVVEPAVAGADARRLQWEAIVRLAEHLEPGRELAPGRELPESISLMSAGAVSGLIFDELIAGRAAKLPARLPDLLFTMLVPYLGPRGAAAEMRKAASQRGT